jgi:hypothetical protein
MVGYTSQGDLKSSHGAEFGRVASSVEEQPQGDRKKAPRVADESAWRRLGTVAAMHRALAIQEGHKLASRYVPECPKFFETCRSSSVSDETLWNHLAQP